MSSVLPRPFLLTEAASVNLNLSGDLSSLSGEKENGTGTNSQTATTFRTPTKEDDSDSSDGPPVGLGWTIASRCPRPDGANRQKVRRKVRRTVTGPKAAENEKFENETTATTIGIAQKAGFKLKRKKNVDEDDELVPKNLKWKKNVDEDDEGQESSESDWGENYA
jgi:hypothetical protein